MAKQQSGRTRIPVKSTLHPLFVSLVIIFCSTAICSALPNDPTYQGKTVSEWLLELEADPSPAEIEAERKTDLTSMAAYEKKRERDENAIRQFGTNALPVLLDLLSLKEDNVRNVLSKPGNKPFEAVFEDSNHDLDYLRKIAVKGFAILGNMGQPAIPQMTQLLADPETSLETARALCKVGPSGLSTLTNALTSDSRNSVVFAIGQDEELDPAFVSGILINCLKDSNWAVRGNAAVFLEGKDPDMAIPALISVLDDDNFYPLGRAAMSLGSFGPAAKSAAPKLFSVYTNLLGGSDKGMADALGGTLIDALQKIDPETAAKAEALLISSSPDNKARFGYTRTLLSDGRELLVGGYLHTSKTNEFLNRADLYDPATKSWTATKPIKTARSSHTATLLKDGRVLIVAGTDSRGALASVELWDPKTGEWTTKAPLKTARFYHSAALQPDGKIAAEGGHTGRERIYDTEWYDPIADIWISSLAKTNAVAPVQSAPRPTVSSVGGEAQPCRTPEELKNAFAKCLQAGDTNLFWALHTWEETSAADQKMHKATALGLFVTMGKTTYSDFGIRPADPSMNNSRPTKSGGSIKPNIPITGIITFRSKSAEMESEDGVPFGRASDGNYRFIVVIRVP